jgi:hypothetical protein
MSATWLILSPLSSKQMSDLEDECRRALDAFLDEYPDSDDTYGEISAEGEIPSKEEVVRGHKRYQLKLPEVILERLAKCKSAMSIDRPGNLETDGLQVSMLRFILERVGEGLIMYNDYPLIETKIALEACKKKGGAPGFGENIEQMVESKSGRRAERPGELRAIRILKVLEDAEENPDLAIDVRDTLQRASKLVQQYAMLLMENGAIDDERASKLLKVKESALEEAATDLDRTLARIT